MWVKVNNFKQKEKLSNRLKLEVEREKEGYLPFPENSSDEVIDKLWKTSSKQMIDQ